MGPEGTWPTVEVGRGGCEWFENWHNKNVTKKGEPTGVDRGASDVEGRERGATGKGTRQ